MKGSGKRTEYSSILGVLCTLAYETDASGCCTLETSSSISPFEPGALGQLAGGSPFLPLHQVHQTLESMRRAFNSD